ncbi:hypothetical protein [Rhodococcus pseudokoreensis]|nr:hypothetical protein [Rhodococcus pseudokoreensis]
MAEKVGDELIAFGRTWAPFGGPSAEDVFVTFGMSRNTYYNKLARVLRARPEADLGELLALCYRREPASAAI